MTILDTPQHRFDPYHLSLIPVEFIAHIDGVDIWQATDDGSVRLCVDGGCRWLDDLVGGIVGAPGSRLPYDRFSKTAIDHALACQALSKTSL